MTIYKFSTVDKKPEENVEGTEVISDLLLKPTTPESAIVTNVTLSAAMRRRRRLLYFLIVLAVLTFIASAAIGVVYLYHHFSHLNRAAEDEDMKMYETSSLDDIDTIKPLLKPITYGVNFFRDSEEEIQNQPHGYFEERVEVLLQKYERIKVPKFDECDRSTIVHDFIYNYTAIVDEERKRCFVMKLNRSVVVPPQDFIDLVEKLVTGHYMPKVRTLREKYIVVPHPVRDVDIFGKFVAHECRHFMTFKLMKFRAFYKKMKKLMQKDHYGYYAFRKSVIKFEIHS